MSQDNISWQVVTILGVAIVVAGVLTYYGIISADWFEKFIIFIVGSIIGGVTAFGYYVMKLRKLKGW